MRVAQALSMSDAKLLEKLEACMTLGSPVLLEGIGDGLDADLEAALLPILAKQVITVTLPLLCPACA